MSGDDHSEEFRPREGFEVERSLQARVSRWLWIGIRLPLTALVVYFNLNLWTLDPVDYGVDGVPDDVVPSLNGIGDDLRAGAGTEMQRLFPEGFVITHGIYGFAWVDVALRAEEGSPLHQRGLREARWAVSRIDTAEAREIFTESLDPPYGAFYQGYLNWLRGGILLADANAPHEEVARFQRACDDIALAFDRADTPYLPSYRGGVWPGDSVFLVATLRLHDTLFTPKYEATVDAWIDGVKQRLDPELKMLPHAVEPDTGELTIPTRGLTAALQGRMLYEVEPDFARDQYARMREHFVTSHLGILPGILEYRKGTSGQGDVDSGPLIFGFSGSATVVGAAAARLHGDRELADPILVGAHAIGIPTGWGNTRRYGFGMLPVGEAFFVWTKTARPWAGPPPERARREPLMLPGWRLVWHAISLVALGLMWFGEVRRLLARHPGHGTSSAKTEENTFAIESK